MSAVGLENQSCLLLTNISVNESLPDCSSSQIPLYSYVEVLRITAWRT